MGDREMLQPALFALWMGLMMVIVGIGGVLNAPVVNATIVRLSSYPNGTYVIEKGFDTSATVFDRYVVFVRNGSKIYTIWYGGEWGRLRLKGEPLREGNVTLGILWWNDYGCSVDDAVGFNYSVKRYGNMCLMTVPVSLKDAGGYYDFSVVVPALPGKTVAAASLSFFGGLVFILISVAFFLLARAESSSVKRFQVSEAQPGVSG